MNNRPVTSIALNPATATIIQDSLVALIPTLRDSRGNSVTGRTVTWTTSATDVAAISTNGVVTAIGPGVATVTAAVDAARATTTITVLPRVASITVTPNVKSLGTGLSQSFVATLRDASGAIITGRSVEWQTIGDPLVATVSVDGRVTSFRQGVVTIVASREGRSGTATLTSFSSIVITSAATNFRVGLAYKFDAARADSTGATTPIIGGLLGGLGLGYGGSAPVLILPIDTTSLYLAMGTGAGSISMSLGPLTGMFAFNIAPNSRDICGRAVGSILLSADDTPIFLGNVSAASDPLSIFNPTGVYGSTSSALSINNPAGRYGSPFSDYSARNPYASRPPFMSKDNATSYFVTLRPNEILGTTPQYLATCPLP